MNSGLLYVYVFSYGIVVPKSVVASRVPSHAFGAGGINLACPTIDGAAGTQCGGHYTGSCANTQANCVCDATHAGIACEEDITATYTESFSFSGKLAGMAKKVYK